MIKRDSGFTLLELLVVILLLSILVGLSSKGLSVARLNAKKARAMMEIKAIETAVKAYTNKYGKPPAPNAALGRSDYGATVAESRAIIATLTAEDAALNPAKLIFLEPNDVGVDGVFLDPWGAPYKIVVDANLDGRVEVLDETVPRSVAVAAVGLRELRGGDKASDLIATWR